MGDTVIPKLSFAGEPETPEMIFATRHHRVLETRLRKLFLNLLVLRGGRPYINERLARFPAESSVDWSGSLGIFKETQFNKVGAIPSEGRKQRAYLTNLARRVAEKISQYVFAIPPEREGVPPEMFSDITRDGQSLNNFLGETLRTLVACKWCWIGIDSPATGITVSQADATAGAIRPYWVLYDPTQVVDWRFDDKGELLWLITQGRKWDNTDPMSKPVDMLVRRLWYPDRMEEWELEINEHTGELSGAKKLSTIPLAFGQVPFVPVGEVSEHPHWYDDVEDIQRALLDLESSLDTLFHKVVFAQPVLPRSVADAMGGESGGGDTAKRFAAIFGEAHAILESAEDKGITRYIGPDGSAIQRIQEELHRKREILFDTVGLHLGFTKNFSESPEVKAFDQLDPEAVLRNYSQQIAEAERKAWALTEQVDPSISGVTTKYAKRFHVSDIFEDFKSLTLLNQFDTPDSMKRAHLHAALDALLEVMRKDLTKEEVDKLRADIDGFEFDEAIDLTEGIAARTVAGVTNQSADDGQGLQNDTRPNPEASNSGESTGT